MKFMRSIVNGHLALAILVALSLSTNSAKAQVTGQSLEDLFTNACAGGTATGVMAALCATTEGATGNNVAGDFRLSGDGQTSVSPGQSLTNNESALIRAYGQTSGVQDRLEEERKERAGRQTGLAAGEAAEFGGVSLYLNLGGERVNRDRILNVDQEKGYEGWKSGFQLGGDYRVGDKLIVGALVGYDHSETTFDPDLPGVGFVPFPDEGGTKSDSAILNVYASYNVSDNLYVDGTVGLGYTDYTLDRNVIFQNTARTFTVPVATSGSTDGYEVNASAGIGYDFYRDALSIGPYARINFGRSTISAFTEEDRSGSGLNMSVQEDTSTTLTSILGVQASYAVSQDWGVLIPQVRFEYEHEYKKDPRSVVSSFAQDTSGNSLALTTDDPDRNYFNFGVSLLLILPNGWMPFVDFETLLSYKDLNGNGTRSGYAPSFRVSSRDGPATRVSMTGWRPAGQLA